MIAVWNRRELCITFQLKEQSEIRNLLTTEGIDYSLKVIDRSSPSVLANTRARVGSYGQDQALMKEYIIYVHKKDYERAANLMLLFTRSQ
ncbi:MAG: hypothetical protein UDG86_08850 [Lachnospiraceae bacterium]|jgi:hypothetical protein|nr:hypothetical protein [Lachnospiraceae bacterium]